MRPHEVSTRPVFGEADLRASLRLAGVVACWAARLAALCSVQMTRTLNAAIAKLSNLPPEEQDRMGQWLLEELRDDDIWTRQFAESQDALTKLAAEGRAERARGSTTDLDPDDL